jgi:hypothetical protein
VTDLEELLNRAADAAAASDPAELFARAQQHSKRRRARRRVLFAGIAAAIVLVAAVAVAATTGSSSPRRVEVSSPTTVPVPNGPPRYEIASVPEIEADGHYRLCYGAQTAIGLSNGKYSPCSAYILVANDGGFRPTKNTIYRFVGTYEAASHRLTLTERPTIVTKPDPSPPLNAPTPCAPPPGGWTTRADHATIDDYNKVYGAAEKMPGYAGLWLGEKRAGYGPIDGVIVIEFAQDVDARRSELSALYGGPLCVAPAPRSEHDVKQIGEMLSGGLGKSYGLEVIATGITVNGHDAVSLNVVNVPPGVQDKIDAKFGKGVVVFEPVLKSVS